MNEIIPWDEWVDTIRPHYPKGERGRPLLEKHGLNKLFFDAIKRVMDATGYIMHGGTIVDATIIDAPSSTKNAEKTRDPEMRKTGRARIGASV